MRRRGGVHLIEALMAFVVGTLVLVMAAALVRGANRASRAADAQLDACEQSRMLLAEARRALRDGAGGASPGVTVEPVVSGLFRLHAGELDDQVFVPVACRRPDDATWNVVPPR